MFRPIAPLASLVAVIAGAALAPAALAATYDVVIRHGTIYDGSGARGYVGDVAIRGDRIVYVGRKAPGKGREEGDRAWLHQHACPSRGIADRRRARP